MKEKVLAIVGPTAIGKTALSITLAQRYHGEVINGDSMQVYKHLDIGTAKASVEEQAGIPHHLLDMLELTDTYNASVFQTLARSCVTQISQAGKLPIVVGGTGLYIEGLLTNMRFGGEGSFDGAYRQQLETRLKQEGIDALYEELARLDVQAAQKIHKQNPRRVTRALEVIHQTGQLFSSQEQDNQVYDSFVIGLTTDREFLYERINQRVDNMLATGLLAEIEWLKQQNLAADTQALQAIGYKEFFIEHVTEDERIELIKRNSRRYAKRQLTWFRNRMQVRWFDPFKDDMQVLLKEVEEWKNK